MRLFRSTALILLCVASAGFADGKDDAAALVKQLQDNDAAVRLKAVKSLEKLGADAKGALPQLAETAAKDPDEDVRTVAARALAKIKAAVAGADKAAALEELAKLLKDAGGDDKDVQAKAVAGLVRLLKNDDEVVRQEAAKALGSAGLAGKAALKDLDDAAKDPDAGVRKEARRAIDKIQAAAGLEAKALMQQKLAPLLKDLKDKSAATRQKALEGIADLGPDAADASEAILSMFSDRSPAVQQSALDALEKVNPTLHKPILTLVVDKDAVPRVQAISQLQKMGKDAKPAVPLLLRLYQAQVADPRQFNPGLLCDLILAAVGDIDPDNRDYIDLVLSVVSSPRQPIAGPGGIGSGAPSRDKAIVMAMRLVKDGHLDASKLVKPLIAAMADPQVEVQAINALGALGADAKDALPALKRLKADPQQAVRDAAADAVKKIE
jgi:HEAT repeat protein